MIGLILLLVIVGVCLWLIETYIPMDPAIVVVIRVIVVVCCVLYLLSAFGVMNVPIPRLK